MFVEQQLIGLREVGSRGDKGVEFLLRAPRARERVGYVMMEHHSSIKDNPQVFNLRGGGDGSVFYDKRVHECVVCELLGGN